MGQGGSKKKGLPKTGPASEPGAQVFRVREQEYHLEGFIVISKTQLHFQPKSSPAIKSFALKHLRAYGQKDGVFSFQTGRAAKDPEKVFRFVVVDGSDIHASLKQHVVQLKSDNSRKASTASSEPASPPPLDPRYEQPGQATEPVTYDSLDPTTRRGQPRASQEQQPEYSHLQHDAPAEQVYSSLDHESQQSSFHSSATGIYRQLDRHDRHDQTYSALEGTHTRAVTAADNPHLYDRLH